MGLSWGWKTPDGTQLSGLQANAVVGQIRRLRRHPAKALTLTISALVFKS